MEIKPLGNELVEIYTHNYVVLYYGSKPVACYHNNTYHVSDVYHGKKVQNAVIGWLTNLHQDFDTVETITQNRLDNILDTEYIYKGALGWTGKETSKAGEN